MRQLEAPWLAGPGLQVCEILEAAGHSAWYVGGCVRNALMQAPVSDLDIATNALPSDVMALAKNAGFNAIPTGIDHGTVTVVAGGIPFEITTLRRDVATDGRRAVVAFADTIEEDAHRRDFTVNAIYCDKTGAISDPIGGMPDVAAGLIRFIDDPAQRIKEDYLRILRFFRFNAWYGKAGIDPEGLAACAEYADGMDGLSSERITSEMLKLLAAPNPAPAIATMAQSGVLWRILPGASADALSMLVHNEQETDTKPDPLRRLIVVGGQRDRLRFSRAQQRQIDQTTVDFPLPEIAYRHGSQLAIDRYLVDQASMSQPADAASIDQLHRAASQTFPLQASDFMPELRGAALGDALKSAEAKWIASEFKLSKNELLAG